MQAKILIYTVLVSISMHINTNAQVITDNQQLIFPAENIASSESNTGDVHLSLLKESGNTMITHFRFSPGSRNFWHYHPNAEQTLLVLDGEGFYQEEGEEKRVIRKGDVIVSKANVRHWNGATPEKPLICITVTEHFLDGHVVQLRPVTDDEYSQKREMGSKLEMCAKLPMSSDGICLLYTSPSPRDPKTSRMPSSA